MRERLTQTTQKYMQTIFVFASGDFPAYFLDFVVHQAIGWPARNQIYS